MKDLLAFVSLAAAAIVLPLSGADSNAQKPATEPAVSIVDDGSTFTLSNPLVTARVSKRAGDLVSLKYKDLEMLGSSGHAGGYWSHSPSGSRAIAAITIDPKTNGGQRGE